MRQAVSALSPFRLSALVTAMLALAPRLRAQQQDDMLVITSGTDTVAVERLRRTPTRLDGELLVKASKLRVSYAATLVGVGRIVELKSEMRRGDADLSSKPLQTATVRLLGDSAIIDINNGDKTTTQRLKSKVGAFPYVNPSFALLEPLILTARSTGKDSVSFPMFFLAGGQTLDVVVRKRGGDTVQVTFAPGQDSFLLVDKDGRIGGGGLPSQNLIVTRTKATGAALFVAPPDYSAPADAPYTATNVTVPTPMGHTLAGTLTVPKGKGPFPAIVTITGSGLQDRDEEIWLVKGYRPFRQIADSLGREGIAVLRMDDRGFGGSGGNAATSTSKDFAEDIRAGLAFLRKRPEIDPNRLGLIGHSEGGLIAPLVATMEPTLKGIVLLAGPAQTGRTILRFQNRYAIDHSATIKPESRDSAFAAAMVALDSVVKASPWLTFFMDYDPLATAAKVKVPALILQGANDQQVTPEQAAALEKAMRAGGNKDVTVSVVPNVNHLFVPDTSGNPAGYTALKDGHIRGDVMQTLVGWLKARLQAKPSA